MSINPALLLLNLRLTGVILGVLVVVNLFVPSRVEARVCVHLDRFHATRVRSRDRARLSLPPKL